MTKVNRRDLREGERVRVTFDSAIGTDSCGLFLRLPDDCGIIRPEFLKGAAITRIEPEPTMTGEELDNARAEEAVRLWRVQADDEPSSTLIAARLAREGWTPPPPVDAAVLACREICAANTRSPVSEGFVIGAYDRSYSMKVALAAYRAGKAAK